MVGKALGLDLGEVTLGIAVSDPLRIIASGVENFRFPRLELDKAVERVKYYCKSQDIKDIALGLPLHMSGDESEHSRMCRDFKAMIEKEIPGIPVHLVDERWTTKQATRVLIAADMSRNKRKKVIDKMAAVIILETYLGI